ncbi:MAG: DUF3592 domain-containing protein, partial [Kiritimatiellaceae bacterium]|nr:DUF3592 domain-containing protein [Kiritimatiellaceae bacterium]
GKTRTGGGNAGKLIFTAFGLAFAIFGSIFVKQQWTALLATKAMQQWEQLPCTIVSSEINESSEDYRLNVSYTYTVNGSIHTGTRFGKQPYYTAGTVAEVDRMRKNYPPGATTSSHYNPAAPAESVLELPSMVRAWAGLVLTLIFPAFGLFFAVIPWHLSRNRKTSSGKGRSTSGKKVMIILGVIFVLAGGLMLKPLLITPLTKTHDAQTWNSVPATVVSSKVKSHDSDDGTTYSVYIAYRYEVNGEEFLGDQYTFMGGSSSGRDAKAEVVRQYPKGHNFEVFVNPTNPDESVIKRDYSLSLLFGLTPLIFMAAGLAVLLAGLRAKKPTLCPLQAQNHVIILKGKSPIAKAIGITLFAIIWNGVVVFLFTSGAPMLFKVIFGIFGLATIAGVVHATLACFNPRPTVELTPGNIHLGTSIAMRWRLSGSIERIRSLKITLHCLKVTTETRRSGGETKTSVIKTPIFTEELLVTENQSEIAHGTKTFVIPSNQPASRAGNDDGIEWRLSFHGDITRWPDIKEDFKFLIYPKSGTKAHLF